MTILTPISQRDFQAAYARGARAHAEKDRDPELEPTLPHDDQEREAWMDGWKDPGAVAMQELVLVYEEVRSER